MWNHEVGKVWSKDTSLRKVTTAYRFEIVNPSIKEVELEIVQN